MAKTKNAAQRVKLKTQPSMSQSASQVSTPATKRLMPPPTRPIQAPTPIQQTPTSAQSDASASARKKRRRRARKSGQSGESFSESASVVSTNTALNTEVSTHRVDTDDAARTPNTNGWSHVNAESPNLKQLPTPATQTSIRDGLNEEQRRLYDREPEIFGDYAMSSVDEDASDSEHDFKDIVKARATDVKSNKHNEVPAVVNSSSQHHETSTQLDRTTATPMNTEAIDVNSRNSSKSQAGVLDQNPTRKALDIPQKSSAANLAEASVPEPLQLPNGRYACPLKETYDCEKTYAYVRDARSHVQEHLDPEKFKCPVCDKVLKRQDKLDRHIKAHNLPQVTETVEVQHAEQARKATGTSKKAKNVTEDEVREQPSIQYEPMDLDVEVTDAEPEPLSDDERGEQQQVLTHPETTLESTSQDIGVTGDIPQTTSSRASKEVTSRSNAVPSLSQRKRKRQPPQLPNSSTVTSKPRKRARRDSLGAEKLLSSQDTVATDNSTESPVKDNATEEVAKQRPDSSDVIIDGAKQNIMPSKGESSRRGALKENSIPVRSRSIPQLKERQSSLDGFVERSSAGTLQSKPADLGKRIVITVPPPPKLNSQRDLKPPKPIAVLSKKVTHSRKGKERAVSSDGNASETDSEHSEHVGVEATSSDDRPKATTVARRTSSLSSKKTNLTKKRKKTHTHEDESDSSDSAAGRSRLNNRPANREASFKELAKMGEIGRFRDREIEVLYGWRDKFCIEHDISRTEFNDMMTATLRKKITWKADISKKDFMQEFYDQLPNRNRRAMLRFRERHFQNLEKDRWTEKDDEELKSLVQRLGQKWVEIGELMGRSQDFLYQRWTHRLNRGNERNTGTWTEAEEKMLFREVQAIAKANGKSPTSKDLVIPWAAISKKLGKHRTSQQCSNKWRNETTKRVGETYVEVPLNDRIPSSGAKAPRTPSKMARRLAGSSRTPASRGSSSKTFKSAERVEDSEEADDEQGEEREEEEDAEHGAKSLSDNEFAASEKSTSEIEDADAASADGDADQEKATDSDGANSAKIPDQSDSDGNEALSQLDEASNAVRVRRYIPSPSPPPRTKASQKASPRKARIRAFAKSPRQDLQYGQKSPPVISKNPFPTEGASNLSQAFEQTQATTAGSRSVKSGGQAHVVPDRPSPDLDVRKRLLSPLKAAASPSNDENTEVGQMDLDDAKSPNSFVSAKEADSSSTEDDDERPISSEEEDDTDGEESDSSDDSVSESGVERGDRLGENKVERTQLNRDPEPPTDKSQAQGGGFWGSISRFARPFSQGRSSQVRTQGEEKAKRRLLDSVFRDTADHAQSDDDDDE